jgi:hypothetical protein
MLHLLQIATQLKTVVEGFEGIAVEGTTKQVFIGLMQAFPTTPACEVIPEDGNLQTLAAGASMQLESARFSVVFYSALQANLPADEQELIPLVEAFIDALTHPDFDYTLGGLVEDVMPTRYSFDIVNRNGRWYRYAAIEVVAGDLGDEV